jgi:hypothetical protein
VDRSDNVYVTGESYGSGSGWDYAALAYSSAGVPLWANRYNGPANTDDSAVALAVDANGNVCVTGSSQLGETDYDFVTIKYAPHTSPVIITQPASRAVTPGSTATFTVSADGIAPLSYQWIKNGTACLSDGGKVSGATTTALTIANAQKVDEAGYRVLITNTLGAALSDTAMLYVLDSPVQFVNCSVHGGVLFQSQLAVLPGTNVILETRTAATSWTPLATNSAPNGILQFSDPMVFPAPPAEAPTIRFYRARLAP